MSGARLTAREAAAEAGCSLRSIQTYAAKGMIPGARQLVDGGAWSFDAAMFRRWLRKREGRRCQEPVTFTSGTEFGGHASRFGGKRFDEAYRRAIGLKSEGVSR